ncbi:MAG: hypothetical protein ACI9YH_003360 [Colwellia sp.]|jgi:hypothetical protein
MNKINLSLTMLIALSTAGYANADAKIKINDDVTAKLGLRVQTLYINRDNNGEDEFKLRRARIRLGANVTDKASVFLQTDVSGKDVKLIDAYITYKPNKNVNIIVGEHMVPASRQSLTTAAALMTLDRPGIAYKAMNWGGRALKNFSNSTINETKAGFATRHAVRDVGGTIFGKFKLSEKMHLKFYTGAYNGSDKPADETLQYASRVQFNFGDAENGYFNSSTYLGKKQTFALGASYSSQSDAAMTVAGNGVDYALASVDVFVEQSIGEGALTIEAAYTDLDLGGAGELTTGGIGTQSEGDGYYAQTGFYINDFQVWGGYESWDSTHTENLGSFSTSKVGITYFLKDHNLNFKAGVEKFDPKWVAESETTFVVGAYLVF